VSLVVCDGGVGRMKEDTGGLRARTGVKEKLGSKDGKKQRVESGKGVGGGNEPKGMRWNGP